MRRSVIVSRFISPIVPYFAVTVGLILFHNAWLAIFSYHAGMLVILLMAGEKRSLRRVLSHRQSPAILAGALAGAAGGSLLYFVWPWLSVKVQVASYIGEIGLNMVTWPLFLAYFVVVNPVIEEYYWRGFLAGQKKGIALNDCWFSGYHLFVLAGLLPSVWLVAVFSVLTLAAWSWRQLNRWNGGMLVSIVSHLAADVAVMLVIFAMS